MEQLIALADTNACCTGLPIERRDIGKNAGPGPDALHLHERKRGVQECIFESGNIKAKDKAHGSGVTVSATARVN